MLYILKVKSLCLVKDKKFNAGKEIEVNFIKTLAFSCLLGFLASHNSDSKWRCNNNVAFVELLI